MELGSETNSMTFQAFKTLKGVRFETEDEFKFLLESDRLCDLETLIVIENNVTVVFEFTKIQLS